MSETQTIKLDTKGNTDIIDITDEINQILNTFQIESGIVNLFVVGSTAGLTMIEYEPGLVRDTKELFQRIAPREKDYWHHEKWHDDNGSAHVRATLLKPDITVPFSNKKLSLGTWQQVTLIDFDTRPRRREIIVTIIS
ncbi:YjbQ family protein [Candidatus Pacearchaeota archaeon]|nr:YjbQ family protein [Candidatus Pacearchaeota archaeon]